MSVGKKVLYLNFSVCNGFCKSMGLEPDMDMGDLFYLLRESEEELLAKLKSGIYPLGSYQVIPRRQTRSIIWSGKKARYGVS